GENDPLTFAWYPTFKIYDGEGLIYFNQGGANCYLDTYYRFDANGIEFLYRQFLIDSVVLDTRSKQLVTSELDYETKNTVIQVINYSTGVKASFNFTEAEVEGASRGRTVTKFSDFNFISLSLLLIPVSFIMKKRRSTS
ncbi:MAG: hypothetical protein ACXAD7_15750, partial [Candidatus Kariarchaeaceae archaeon]